MSVEAVIEQVRPVEFEGEAPGEVSEGQAVEESLIEEVSIDGMCGVY